MFHITISGLKYLSAKYTFFLFTQGRKVSGHLRTPGHHEVGEIVTTTGDVDVVEEDSHFTSASVHVLIGEIMVCNRDLQKIKEDINDVEKRLKNIIDVLGRI
ncbi:hypothetical protein AB205_0070090 [Aquarana catesbeiana]|nr:hypothetical protein AB205_0070090 [Aquarana catesbeiana]